LGSYPDTAEVFHVNSAFDVWVELLHKLLGNVSVKLGTEFMVLCAEDFVLGQEGTGEDVEVFKFFEENLGTLYGWYIGWKWLHYEYRRRWLIFK